jgi:hypothetical protein
VVVLLVPLVIVLRRRRIGSHLYVIYEPSSGVAPRSQNDDQPEPPATGDEFDADSGSIEQADRVRGRRLVVGVLGPLLVEGLADTKRQRAVEELFVYLVLNSGREVPSSELRVAFAKGDKDMGADVLYNLVSELRKALGKDVVVRTGKFGYAIRGEVDCDWASFRGLVNGPHLTDDKRITDLTEAFVLVRGVAFSSVPENRYAWAGPLGEEIRMTIESRALELAAICNSVGRRDEAYAATVAGLRGSPYCTALFSARLRSAGGDRVRFDEAWNVIVKADMVTAELQALRASLMLDL